MDRAGRGDFRQETSCAHDQVGPGAIQRRGNFPVTYSVEEPATSCEGSTPGVVSRAAEEDRVRYVGHRDILGRTVPVCDGLDTNAKSVVPFGRSLYRSRPTCRTDPAGVCLAGSRKDIPARLSGCHTRCWGIPRVVRMAWVPKRDAGSVYDCQCCRIGEQENTVDILGSQQATNHIEWCRPVEREHG